MKGEESEREWNHFFLFRLFSFHCSLVRERVHKKETKFPVDEKQPIPDPGPGTSRLNPASFESSLEALNQDHNGFLNFLLPTSKVFQLGKGSFNPRPLV